MDAHVLRKSGDKLILLQMTSKRMMETIYLFNLFYFLYLIPCWEVDRDDLRVGSIFKLRARGRADGCWKSPPGGITEMPGPVPTCFYCNAKAITGIFRA